MISAAREARSDFGSRQGKRALLVVNLRSRSGREGMEETTACLTALGFDVTPLSADDPSDLPGAITASCNEQDLVIVAGGDGSVNLALEPILQSGLPLGLIPLGTANDLARTLEIPPTIEEACRVIAAGHMRRINLGRVANKLFVNVASLGLSTAVARFHRGERKRRWRVLSYLFSVWDALKVTRPFRATITCDGVRHRYRCLQISVGNGVYYGGGMAISADASIEQETLDLTILRPTSLWTLLRLTPSLRSGTHGRHPEATTAKCRRLRIDTRRPRPINADGELLARTPAEFSVVPGALHVFAPNSQETESSEAILLRDQIETSLSDLLQAAHQVTRAYRTAAELLTGCGESEVFAELAEAAEKASLDLDAALREAGMPPPAPDVELSFFRSLLARGEALLRSNERLTLIEHCQRLENEVLSAAELANSREPAGELPRYVQVQATRALSALDVLESMRSADHQQ